MLLMVFGETLLRLFSYDSLHENHVHKLTWVCPELVADSGFGNTANSDLAHEELFKKIVRKTLQY